MDTRLTVGIARDWLTTLRRATESVADDRLLPVVLGQFRQQNPFICEDVVMHCFGEAGFQIHKPTGYTGDAGIDGICTLDECQFLVQIKRYQGYVNLSHIEQFTRLVCHQRERNPDVVAGFFVHSGKTGATAKAVINYRQAIILISGRALVQFLLDPIDALSDILEKHHATR